MQRDGVTRDAAQRVLDAQSTRAQRLAIADDVIVNDGEESALDAQITALHARYLKLAGDAKP
jgi:dephospho-CoA kinase